MKTQFLFLVLLLLGSYNTNACSCFKVDSLNLSQYVDYQLIFKGKVVSVEKNTDKFTNFEDYVKAVVVKVKKVYKGTIKEKLFTIYTPISGAACGVNFNVGQQWIIYTYENKGKQHTSLCDRTFLKSDKHFNKSKWKPEKKLIKKLSAHNGFIKDASAQGVLKNQNPIGNWSFYNNGILSAKYAYNQLGQKHGKCYRFKPDGSISFERIFGNGKLLKTITYNNQGEIEHIQDYEVIPIKP